MPRTDFNGDGRDDIIWQNIQSGVVTNWLAQPDGGFIGNDAAGLDPWAIGHLVGIGDFDADGRSDTLWREDNGDIYLSLTYPDGAFYFYWSTGFVAPLTTNWNIAGVADFNGDGRSDLLLRDWNGWLVEWLADPEWGFNANNAATTWVHPDWYVTGTGDFDNDGIGDILLRHPDGNLVQWLGQSDGSFASNSSASNWLHPDWYVTGTGDFDGDGRTDVLLRHENGWIVEWQSQEDGSFAAYEPATTWLHPAWTVVGTGDYNGGGRDDLLLWHVNGTITNWLSGEDGSFSANGEAATYQLDVAWQVLPDPAGTGFWDY